MQRQSSEVSEERLQEAAVSHHALLQGGQQVSSTLCIEGVRFLVHFFFCIPNVSSSFTSGVQKCPGEAHSRLQISPTAPPSWPYV